MKDFFSNISLKNFNLNSVLDMASKVTGGLGSSLLNGNLGRIRGVIDTARNLIKNPELRSLKSLATGGLGRLLRSRGVMSALPVGLGSLINGALGNLGGSLPSLGQGCGGSELVSTAVQSGLNKLESLLGSASSSLTSSLGLGNQGSGMLSGAITSFVSGRSGMLTALTSSGCNCEFCVCFLFCFRN